MADVTFGVKVSEEMKLELSDLMKSTSLTGKEFMNLLIHTYKLEKERVSDTSIGSDIEELQRLLQRVQHLYLNMHERTGLLVEERLREQHEIIAQKEHLLEEQVEKEATYQKELDNLKQQISELRSALEEKDAGIASLEEVIEAQKVQIKQQSLLEQKYEAQVLQLQEALVSAERIGLEVEERNKEITLLKNRNDEMSSEVWFMQRESEKKATEYETILQQKESELKQLREHSVLEQRNALLEQKLQFNQKIDLLKEEHFKVQQTLNEKIQAILIKNE